MKSIKSYHFNLVVTILLSGCAQIVTPTGGDKDIIPPRIIKMVPDNYTTSFTSTQIVIGFDEYVSLKSVQQQVVISPPLNNKPEYRISKKSLIIELKDTLQANTTYTINLGDAVVDITEGNPLDSNLVVFSTGTFIDSMSVSGNLTNSFDLKVSEDVYVMLYDAYEDSIPYKTRPTYFSKTNDKGFYKISNIRKGSYKVFALKDANQNYLFDSPAESIAFLDTVLVLDSAQQLLDLVVFNEIDTAVNILSKSYTAPGKFTIITKGGVNQINARVFQPDHGVIAHKYIAEEKDTAIYWVRGERGQDTIQVEIELNNTIVDTIKLQLKKEKENKPHVNRKLRLTTNTFGLKMNLNGRFQIHFDVPVQQFDLSGVIMTKGLDTLRPVLPKVDSSITRYVFPFDEWEENIKYSVHIPSGSATDIYGATHDSITFNFSTEKITYYGSVKFKVEAPEGETDQILIQLFNANSKK